LNINKERTMKPFTIATLPGLLLVSALAIAQPATAPPPAAAKIAGESVGAPDPLFVVHLTTGPAWEAGKPANEQPGFREHSANLNRLRTEGILVMGARYRDRDADKGMMVFRAANREAVAKQFEADPMVEGKLFAIDIAEFAPFYDGFIARPARNTTLPGALEKMQWLAGCWFGRNGKMEFREHWMRPAGNLMMGMGRTLSEGKVIGHEAMRLEVDAAGAIVFVAKPAGQNEASFKLVTFEDNRFVFENPMNDFPTRVIYHFKADGSLDARIEGKRNGRDARVEFPMRRASCE
jgi:uncharacterized protein YciI